MSDKQEQVIEILKGMTLLEAAELVKKMEDIFGVSAAAPVAVAAGPVAVATVVEEKTEFNVMIVDIGDKKINVIKVVRELTNLGLKEAKELVEAAPKAVLENVEKSVAEAAKAKLEEVGASIEIK
jgi:large subunit ribosomal protein L7/L12